jgi:hypothetical protein
VNIRQNIVKRLTRLLVHGLKVLFVSAGAELARVERRLSGDVADPAATRPVGSGGQPPPAAAGQPPAHWLAKARSSGPPAHWLATIRRYVPDPKKAQTFDVTLRPPADTIPAGTTPADAAPARDTYGESTEQAGPGIQTDIHTASTTGPDPVIHRNDAEKQTGTSTQSKNRAKTTQGSQKVSRRLAHAISSVPRKAVEAARQLTNTPLPRPLPHLDEKGGGAAHDAFESPVGRDDLAVQLPTTQEADVSANANASVNQTSTLSSGVPESRPHGQEPFHPDRDKRISHRATQQPILAVSRANLTGLQRPVRFAANWSVLHDEVSRRGEEQIRQSDAWLVHSAPATTHGEQLPTSWPSVQPTDAPSIRTEPAASAPVQDTQPRLSMASPWPELLPAPYETADGDETRWSEVEHRQHLEQEQRGTGGTG